MEMCARSRLKRILHTIYNQVSEIEIRIITMRIDIILHRVNIHLMFIPRYFERCQSNNAESSVYRERTGIASDTSYLTQS